MIDSQRTSVPHPSVSPEWVLEPSGDNCIDSLFRRPAFELREWQPLFVGAMREAFSYHNEHCQEFQQLASIEGIRAEDICTLADVERIPWMFVGMLKSKHLISIEQSQVYKRLTSSGTRGEQTQLILDRTSLNRMLVADYQVYFGMGVLENREPCCCQLFGYDLETEPDLGPAYSTYKISEMTPCLARRPLIRSTIGSLRFSVNDALRDYLDFVETGAPLRWIGYPAFMYRTLVAIRERNLPKVPQPEWSWVQSAGG